MHRQSKLKLQCKYPGCNFKGTPRRDYLWHHIRKCHSPRKDLRAYYHELLKEGQLSSAAERDLQFLEAVGRDDDEEAQQLLTAGADLWTEDSRRRSAFEIAVDKGSNKPLKLLLATAKHDMTPKLQWLQESLYTAISKRNEEQTRILLDHGADPTCISSRCYCDERSALKFAIEGSSVAIVKLLLQRGARLNFAGWSAHEKYEQYGKCFPFHSAIANKEPQRVVAIVELLLHYQEDDLFQSQCGRRALLFAIGTNKYTIVEDLLSHDAPIEYLEEGSGDFHNALRLACARGRPEIVDVLLARGVKINKALTHWYDKTALQKALLSDKFNNEMTRILIRAGGALVDREKEGQTSWSSLVRSTKDKGRWHESSVWQRWDLDRVAAARRLLKEGARLDNEDWQHLPDKLQNEFRTRILVTNVQFMVPTDGGQEVQWGFQRKSEEDEETGLDAGGG